MAAPRKAAFSPGPTAPPGSGEDQSGGSYPRSGASAALLTPEEAAPERDVYNTDEWRLACRVACSRGLSKSDLLPKFLLHICEMSLRGRSDEITEQRIGTLIFNRPPDYNPGEDNIVRSYARTMRRRLDDYFASEGRDEPLRIHIPRGGYVPLFVQATGRHAVPALPSPLLPEEDAEPELTATLPRPQDARAAGPTWRSLWIGILIGLLAGALLATAAWLKWTAVKVARSQSPAHAVWSQIFQANRNTLIVPADSGLGILENLTKRSVPVEQYANGSYLADMPLPPSIDRGNFADLGRQRYTSVVDLDIAARLTRLPEYIDSRAQIRFARGVTAEDIKDSNAILLGSNHTDPWVMLFEKSMNFTFEYTNTVDQSYVVNRSPLPGQPKLFRNGTAASPSLTYGVIAYLPSLDGAGHVLIVEGLNMAATEAAAEILFNEKVIRPVLRQASLPDGTLRPFELLIETSSVGAASPGSKIIDTRIHDQ